MGRGFGKLSNTIFHGTRMLLFFFSVNQQVLLSAQLDPATSVNVSASLYDRCMSESK